MAKKAPSEKKENGRAVKDLFARLKLLPISSPLAALPQLRSEEALGAAAESNIPASAPPLIKCIRDDCADPDIE